MLPIFPAIALRRARAAARARDLAAAARHYQAFLRRRPHAIGAWIQLGHVLKESGQADAAEQAYRQATRVAPHRASGHRELGRFLERLGRREQASWTFLRGLAVAPDAIDLQDALMANGHRVHDLDGLLLLAALEVGEPTVPERRDGRMIWNRARAGFHASLAHRAERKARWSDARRHLLRSLSADPSRPPVHLRLGHVLTAIGDHHQAAAAFRRAISWSPHHAEAYTALGRSLAALGDARGAGAAFATAVRLAPACAPARESLLAMGWSSDQIDDMVAATWAEPQSAGRIRGPQATSWRRVPQVYMIPSFLLRRPGQGGDAMTDEWRLSEPDLVDPVSQLCTARQMQSPAYAAQCARIGLDPRTLHRKTWEFVFICAALEAAGCLEPGRRGLGFGIGREPLPSAFAARGVDVTATDAPADIEGAELWTKGTQRADATNVLFRPDLVAREVFDARVTFRAVDMNAIPADLRGYDFCWSSCCLEHLGSLRHGLDFIAASLDTLRPGGIAVHTTEFNLTSNEQTFESPGLSLFRMRDIEAIAAELTASGHHVRPLNFWPGVTAVDEHIDLPPFSDPHLKLQMAGYVTTSFGLIVRKAET